MACLFFLILFLIHLCDGQVDVNKLCQGLDNCSLKGYCEPDAERGGVQCICNHGFEGDKCSVGPNLLELDVPQEGAVTGLEWRNYQVPEFKVGDEIVLTEKTNSVALFMTVGAVPRVATIGSDPPAFQYRQPVSSVTPRITTLTRDLTTPLPGNPVSPLFITIYNETPGTNADFVLVHRRSVSLFGLGAGDYALLAGIIFAGLSLAFVVVYLAWHRRAEMLAKDAASERESEKSKSKSTDSSTNMSQMGSQQQQQQLQHQHHQHQQQMMYGGAYGGGSMNGGSMNGGSMNGGSMNGYDNNMAAVAAQQGYGEQGYYYG